MRTPFRGGERRGIVKRIATTEEETPHPPKVIFDIHREGQEPKEVAHNPSTLEKGECVTLLRPYLPSWMVTIPADSLCSACSGLT